MNVEIFVTDAPDVDFDSLNDQQALELMPKFDQTAGDGDQGGVVKKDITPAAAYKYFLGIFH